MSQDPSLVLRLAKTLGGIRLLAVVFTLIRLEQNHRLIDHRDDFREIDTLGTEINFRLDTELLSIREDQRSSSIARLANAVVL